MKIADQTKREESRVVLSMIFYPVIFWGLSFLLDLYKHYSHPVTEDSISFFNSMFSIFAIIMIFLVCLNIYWSIEKFAEYSSNKISLFVTLRNILITFVMISVQYAIAYNCLFLMDSNSFANVTNNNFFERSFDFLYYSFGIFSTNSLSEIVAKTIICKTIVMTEMLTTLILIVLLISNFERIGAAFNKK